MPKIDLANLDKNQWENLCDGCGRCCLHKIEDENNKIYFTDVACKYLDDETCQCTNYKNRKKIVTNCLSIKKDWLKDSYKFNWLPVTCSYRLAFENKDLPIYHHQISGDKNSIHYAGISIRGRHFSDADISKDDFENHIVDWVK